MTHTVIEEGENALSGSWFRAKYVHTQLCGVADMFLWPPAELRGKKEVRSAIL